MSAAILTPPPALPVPTVKFTVTEFDQMGDMGWFEGRGAFLFEGTVREKGEMNPPHAIAITLVQQALQAVFRTGWVIRCQLPLHLDRFNNPLPDFALVPGGPRDYQGRHPTTADLIVEVSDTTLAFDMIEQRDRYCEAGIADYWILDLIGQRLLVYRDPDPATSMYRNQQALGSADRVSPLAAPGGFILVADLLP